MNRLINFIKNIFKVAKVLSIDDSGDFQFASVSFLGKTQKVMMFTPYGLISNPPPDSMCLLWSQQGQESNGIGIPDDPKNRPVKDTLPGEAGVANYETGAYILFVENGDANLVVPGDFIGDAANFELNGNSDNLVMWTDLNSQLQSFVATFNSHTHGGGATPDQSVTLDLSGAKADTLKTDG